MEIVTGGKIFELIAENKKTQKLSHVEENHSG